VKVLSRFAGPAVLLLVFACSLAVSAQTTPKAIEAATLWDEYGTIGGCDHSARLENLTTALQNNLELEGYLVYYGPESASDLTLGIIKDYLTNSRGLGEERYKTIYAGPNSDPREPRIQLWLAPRGSAPPELPRYASRIETFTGLFSEDVSWDGVYLGEGEGTGPPVPGVSFPTFVDMLKNRQDTVAYIVAFNGDDAAPGAWRRVGQMESERIEKHGVAASRLKLIFGGADKETKVQLWILPADAPAPVADAGPERLPQKTIQVSDFGDYELGDERGERWAFKVLLDGLRTNDKLRACIIVRMENEVAEELDQEEAQAITEVAPVMDETPEPQPANFLKLIEKWKAELTDKYKIPQDRLVVLFTTPREDEGNKLETWIIPPGALLPDPDVDPYAEDDESNEKSSDTSGDTPEEKPPPDLSLTNAEVIQQSHSISPVLLNFDEQFQMTAMPQQTFNVLPGLNTNFFQTCRAFSDYDLFL
jgi:hypothetical protein